MMLLPLALAQEADAEAGCEICPDFVAAAIDADLLQPTVSGRMLVLEDAQPLEGEGYALRLLGQSARDPYIWIDRFTGEETAVLSSFTGMTLGAAYWRGAGRVGLDMPVYLASTGPIATGGAGLGDARAHGRWLLFEGSSGQVGLAGLGAVLIPIGDPSRLLAQPVPTMDVGFALDYQQGPTLWALNLGLRVSDQNDLHPSVVWGRQLHFGFGAAVAVTELVDVHAEVVGRTQLSAPFSYSQGTPIEALAGLQVDAMPGMHVRLAGGTGLTPGIGAPAWRVVGAMTWTPGEVNHDADLDGILDAVDACSREPEDFDGFEDEDGCADPDNDGDGLSDLWDRCPDQAEDVDGYEDEDGCAEGNNHLVIEVLDWRGEPVLASRVHVAPANEMGDVYERTWVSTVSLDLSEGRWEVRVQADGYADWSDTLALTDGETQLSPRLRSLGGVALVRLNPLDREEQPLDEVLVTIDGELSLQLLDGEPTLELSEGEHHLLIQKEGHVPVELTVDVLLDEERSARVQLLPDYLSLEGDLIALTHPVNFDPGTAALTPRGQEILDQVASLLEEHPEIALLRIEAHADDGESSEDNLKLSQMRADTVRAELVMRGVKRKRLSAVGFGDAYPPADVWPSENRRIDFYVEERERPE